MSFAFEVTPGEVLEVMEAHKAADALEDEIVDDGFAAVVEMEDRITEAVLEYADESTRRAFALREIEAILIEEGLLEGPSRFATLE